MPPHLFVGDGHGVLEDDPFNGLAAGRRGQRAVVGEILLCGVREEASQGEGQNLCTLSWTRRRENLKQTREKRSEEKREKKKVTYHIGSHC